MQKKKIQVKKEFPEGSQGTPKKIGLTAEDTGYGKIPLEIRQKIYERWMVQLNYDLLQVPGYIDAEVKPDEDNQEPPVVPPIEEEEEVITIKKPVHLLEKFPTPKRPRVSPYSGREKTANPAPHSRDFEPDWIDVRSGIELSLATYTPLVDEKKRMDKGAIVFWARASGKRKDGRPKTFPLTHEKVELMDIRTGEIVGYGNVAERYFTPKRVMGVIVLRPLRWDPVAPLYA